MSQLSHYTTNFEEKRFPVVLILDGLTSPANVGSIFRLADAFNIEKILLCGSQPDMKSNRLTRTARSTVEKVVFEEDLDTALVCKNYLEMDYTLLALEITSNSIPINTFSFSGSSKIALVIGNERTGISEEILELIPQKLHIEMFGKNSSMNVAQATGIALYEITKGLPHI
ncbi:TrmH family RNA methyltransferase [Salinimicrobium sp. GXAS 041]|uniref:TrmH family RNA methyltransferase n=1 Tax=Salinimicrobium sp. GXAS 041 TaxID=3400806 RepID=UPI003C74C61C